ncbi:MAG TPA: hypothetical protein VKA41_03315 [Solirubrobacterales bacterium]|nr:hypothetical protein [Solirubrobacterales bacterium]
MRWPRRTARLAILLATGTVLAGCGGGSERVSAAELVQKADAICGKERSSFARIQAHPPPNASVAADQTDELIEATQEATSELRDLKPPEDLQSAYDRYLEARGRAIEQMKRGKDAAQDRDSAAYGAAQAAVAREAPQRRKLSQALGLQVCSSSTGTA